MNRLSDIFKYKAVVWDLDGTLYFQKKMRFIMAAELLKYYITHPLRIKELIAVKRFREIRECWDKKEKEGESLEDAQYAYTASVLGMGKEDVKRAVEMWIYDRPLAFIRRCRDEKAAEVFLELRKKGIPCYIFSDYPIEDKLGALELVSDGNYAATDERVSALKPDPKGLLLILKDHGLAPGEVLMIGDRDSRDGEAARRAGCDYVVLSRSAEKRKRQYRDLPGQLL